jgi:dolichol-phosphate mannosyltransferase
LRQDTALSSLILFTDIAYKLSMLMTGIMILATVATGIYVIVVNILGRPVAGFTTMMLVMTGCFFGVFAILAIIIKYLSVILDLVFKKQKYVIGSVEKVT